jgi:hypothetical protein
MRTSLRLPTLLALPLALVAGAPPASSQQGDATPWTVFITNDTCPDYTWGNTETQTRRNFAELVRSHLDEMNGKDKESPENRDHYTMAATMEALCFLECYPERREELIRRIREGRVLISPFLCNTMWGFQSIESVIRSLYPARRLERDWGIPIDVAHHIELPSLPWGVPTILAGCGIRWLNIPFLDYDSTFAHLTQPPLFIHEGPDGSRMRVLLDSFASVKANYAQGAYLLKKPDLIVSEWIPHYEKLGALYPLRATLASGTHSDTYASSAAQTPGFAASIASYNATPAPHPRLVNGTLAQFFRMVDENEAGSPFLKTLRGCFGHSWDLWPVSLASYAAAARENERQYLAAETLVAIACLAQPGLREATRVQRERAEWCWAMLADHAWNGIDEPNRRENARLRREWNEELSRLTVSQQSQGWAALGFTPSERGITLFNSLSVERRGLVRLPGAVAAAEADGGASIPCQVVREDGADFSYLVAPRMPGFSLTHLGFVPGPARSADRQNLRATGFEMEGPYYRLKVDPATGGVSSLVHKPTGSELVPARSGRSLCQTVFYNGQDHVVRDVKSEVVAEGPVIARLRITGTIGAISLTSFITVYADLDQVDFDLRVRKPVSTEEQRLCHFLPVLDETAGVRLETAAALIRPEPQPRGDLLPGADPRRFSVQGFVDASIPGRCGVTIVPLDAFALRRDLGPIVFEALGNDQNYKEVKRDQDGITEFRFRYVLRGHAGGYDNASAIAWSRTVSTPLLAAAGTLSAHLPAAAIAIDAARAVATSVKPAEGPAGEGIVVRLWETREEGTSVPLRVKGFRRAVRTDLLERDCGEVAIVHGELQVPIRPRGLAAIRLLP